MGRIERLAWIVLSAALWTGIILAFVIALTDVLKDRSESQTYHRNGFEYQVGAVTAGCAFYGPAYYSPYGKDNPDKGVIVLAVVGNREQDVNMRLIIDGPRGFTSVVGYKCGVSIDWSAFPELEESQEEK